MMPKERDSENPKIFRTHVCVWWISYKKILHLLRHTDDRQQNNESAGSSSGLSSGASRSHDINPAFDSESQDEVITQSDPPLYSKEKIMYFFSETRPLSRHFLKKVFFASKKFQTVVRMSKFSKSNNRRKMAVYWDPPAPHFHF